MIGPRSRTARVALLGVILGSSVSSLRAVTVQDPLAAEIARWAAFLRDDPTAGIEMLASLKQDTEPGLARTEKALHDGRSLLALYRLASVQANLAPAAYLLERSAAQRQQEAEFEKEWARMGEALKGDLTPPDAMALAGVRPAAVRAVGEAALPKVRVLYEASLEYGRNTMPDAGLYYVGAALAQKQFAAFCRSLSVPTPQGEPSLRSLDGELDALQTELLAAYRPPASIDRHPQFIIANAAIKEARELEAAGLRYGALYRYLEATLRVAQARAPAAPPDADALARRLREWDLRLSGGGVDQSLGRLYLEAAQANADATAGADPAVASAIVADVLPRYLAALEPAPSRPSRPKSEVTVTLVRWPYT